LTKKIEPSSETYQKTYIEASKFASENASVAAFNKAIADKKLDKKVASLNENDLGIAGLESSRQLVRAAFAVEPGTICMNNENSPIFEFGNRFVIAAVAGATEAGPSSFEDARPRVELAVRKNKKAEMLSEKMKGASDLSSLASKLSTEVKEATGINFTSYSVPNLGFEPAVVGAVCSLPEGKTSSPIVGNNGVYVAKVTSVTTGTDNNLKAEKQRLAQTLSYQAGPQIFDALKQKAEIVDKRSKFY
jgi:peptidyl-prolyl cis-trans isomerase D